MYRGPVAGEDVAWLDQGKTEGYRGKSWSRRANRDGDSDLWPLLKSQLCPGNNRKILVNFQMEDEMIR